MRYVRTWLIVGSIVSGYWCAPAQERSYTASAFGTFTTSSKLFPHSGDPDEFTRGQFLPLDDIFSFGIELRRELSPLHAEIGLSIEYISKTETRDDSLSSSTTVPVTDGYKVVPIELTGYFFIPFSGERFQLFMGGGGGIYPGIRRYEYAGANAATSSRSIGVGIHVVSGVEYVLSDFLSLRGTIKFRDVQFETVNKFDQAFTVYNNAVIGLNQDPLSSRINVDGMASSIGVVIHF